MNDTGFVRNFYDELAENYHLIGQNWDGMVRNQGRILDSVIKKLRSSTPQTILDCSCGIGTQAIGLALQGHSVTASDLSSKAVDRARAEAMRMGAIIQDFWVTDFRNLGHIRCGGLMR